MKIWNDRIELSTGGHGQVADLTPAIEDRISDWGVEAGLGTVFVPGSTAAITTIEYEPGVVRDLQELLEKLAPCGARYQHDAAWGDGNGYAHLRAALLGPSLSFPVRRARLVRGTWQQIVLCDFDNRPRKRVVEIQVVGTGRGGG